MSLVNLHMKVVLEDPDPRLLWAWQAGDPHATAQIHYMIADRYSCGGDGNSGCYEYEVYRGKRAVLWRDASNRPPKGLIRRDLRIIIAWAMMAAMWVLGFLAGVPVGMDFAP